MSERELSQNEVALIKALREQKPSEIIEIRKGLDGKPKEFVIRREQRMQLERLGYEKLTKLLMGKYPFQRINVVRDRRGTPATLVLYQETILWSETIDKSGENRG